MRFFNAKYSFYNSLSTLSPTSIFDIVLILIAVNAFRSNLNVSSPARIVANAARYGTKTAIAVNITRAAE